MLSIKFNIKLFVILAFGCVTTATVLNGCGSAQKPQANQHLPPETRPPKFALFGPPPERSGVELWSDNCARCHNSRPTQEFSDAQWATIVHHMRLRANLTGDEQRKITAFLQASN